MYRYGRKVVDSGISDVLYWHWNIELPHKNFLGSWELKRVDTWYSTLWDDDGITVGAVDGSSEGLIVGTSVGAVEGPTVGTVLGTSLGDDDGITVGEVDGSSDGLTLGTVLGTSLGDDDGITVGAVDGSSEGLIVGTSVLLFCCFVILYFFGRDEMNSKKFIIFQETDWSYEGILSRF